MALGFSVTDLGGTSHPSDLPQLSLSLSEITRLQVLSSSPVCQTSLTLMIIAGVMQARGRALRHGCLPCPAPSCLLLSHYQMKLSKLGCSIILMCTGMGNGISKMQLSKLKLFSLRKEHCEESSQIPTSVLPRQLEGDQRKQMQDTGENVRFDPGKSNSAPHESVGPWGDGKSTLRILCAGALQKELETRKKEGARFPGSSAHIPSGFVWASHVT